MFGPPGGGMGAGVSSGGMGAGPPPGMSSLQRPNMQQPNVPMSQSMPIPQGSMNMETDGLQGLQVHGRLLVPRASLCKSLTAISCAGAVHAQVGLGNQRRDGSVRHRRGRRASEVRAPVLKDQPAGPDPPAHRSALSREDRRRVSSLIHSPLFPCRSGSPRALPLSTSLFCPPPVSFCLLPHPSVAEPSTLSRPQSPPHSTASRLRRCAGPPASARPKSSGRPSPTKWPGATHTHSLSLPCFPGRHAGVTCPRLLARKTAESSLTWCAGLVRFEALTGCPVFAASVMPGYRALRPRSEGARLLLLLPGLAHPLPPS